MNEITSTLWKTDRPSYDDISRKARALWENYGRPAGRDEEIWLEAERMLASAYSGNGDNPDLRPVDTPLKRKAAAVPPSPDMATTSLTARPRGSKPARN